MWEYMERRARQCAEYILKTGTTVRECAKHFNISKSTVHKDVTERLKEVDLLLWGEVQKVLRKNLAERHIRGGDATRRKYSARKVINKKEF
ncbi:MAG: stage III sporulation protein D [Bacillota bacterium]|nr:MAG: stage III sporulation protein D [Bacillota bacterium]